MFQAVKTDPRASNKQFKSEQKQLAIVRSSQILANNFCPLNVGVMCLSMSQVEDNKVVYKYISPQGVINQLALDLSVNFHWSGNLLKI